MPKWNFYIRADTLRFCEMPAVVGVFLFSVAPVVMVKANYIYTTQKKQELLFVLDTSKKLLNDVSRDMFSIPLFIPL